MIILHLGAVGDGEFALWGETPEAERRGRLPGPRSESSVRGRPVVRLPFDAGPSALAEALATAGIVVGRPAQQAWGWLPSRGSRPIATSRLVDDAPRSSGRAALAPWRVTAQPLMGGELVELVTSCAGAHTIAPGVVVGPDLTYWVGALQLAAALVARQQYLPSLADATIARWMPVITGEEEHLAEQLAEAMPCVVRALSAPDVSRPARDPREVLDAFLGRTVDAIVRQASISADPVVEPRRVTAPPRSGRAASQRTRPTTRFDSVHDAWAHALTSVNAMVSGAADTASVAELDTQLREWERPISESSQAPFRLLFRLDEPPADPDELLRVARGDEPTWRLSTLLQARFDPSLIVPITGLLTPSNGHAHDIALLDRHGFDAVRHLLGPLGQAASVCELIAAGLEDGAFGAIDIDDAHAFEFLTVHSVTLERAGFGVMLPAWFTRAGAGTRLTLRARVTSKKDAGPSAGLSLDRVAQVQWAVALDDATLTQAELRALARAKIPLVRLRGQWVQVDADEVRAALERWGRKATDEMSVRDLVRMALTGESPFEHGGGGRPSSFRIDGVDASGWIGDLLSRLDGSASFEELAAPETLNGTLRPYQLRGFSWLAFLRELGFGACLADDMGLGKTVQTLASIAHDHEAERSSSTARTRGNGRSKLSTPPPVLLVCPTSVVGNWQREAARFTPELPVLMHHGTERLDGAAFTRTAQRHGLVVTTYALLHRDFDRLARVTWGGIVLDEAQNIKNPETKQARAARALKAGWRVALTGTPVENHVGDLWSVMEFLNPGLLGNRTRFRREYLMPIQSHRDDEAAGRLRRVTGPFVLRRLKTDRSIIRDLPRKNEMKVHCSLTSEQASLYQAVLDDIQERIESADEDIERRGLVLALMTKLKQVCNHPAQLLGDGSHAAGRSGKLERLTEMLEEVLEVGERALVFTQFTQMGSLIRNHLEATFGQEVDYLHGGTSKRARDEMVDRFQRGDGSQILLLSLKAGGTGLNLTAANHVFHFDRWWNPAVEDQATDRAFRIGQRRPVSVHKFVCLGTFEQRIDELIDRKQSIAGAVVGSGDRWLTELSNAQLRDLFSLREERVTV